MGLSYGYDIYLSPRNATRLLAGLAEPTPTAPAVPPLEITPEPVPGPCFAELRALVAAWPDPEK